MNAAAATAFTMAGLRSAGFEGFRTVAELRSHKIEEIPEAPCVYTVLKADAVPPGFLAVSRGGWFNRKDPTVPVSVLEDRWVPGTPVLYVGKVTSGRSGRTHLRRRVSALLAYGAGKPIGHQGGRYLWQLAGGEGFLVAWKVADAPTAEENRLLTAFSAAFGRLPFANIAGPRG